MRHQIFTLYEYYPREDDTGKYVDEKRRIFTFDSYDAAYEVMVLIEKYDALSTALGIEQHEITT